MKVTKEIRCRVCRGELLDVLDLGEIVPSGFTDGKVISEKAPLVLAECRDCNLVQLRHTVDLDQMYRQYWYASSLNKSMVSSLQDIVNEVEERVKLDYGDVVLDIGCNDGTLLGLYSKDVLTVGFDPALNLDKTIPINHFVNDYFSLGTYQGLPQAKVITAIAMFYDLPDPHQFVEDVVNILHKEGIFVIQFTDLLSMYKACAFDNICHEHLEYYKFADVKFLLEAHGLEVIDVSYNDVNGGSIRITAAHNGAYKVSKSVRKAYKLEEAYIDSYGFGEFKQCIESTIIKMNNFLSVASNLDLSVFLMGASTKGNTFLQICKIDRYKVPYAAEVNKSKFGLYTAGSNIYIIPEEEALSMNPDFFLVPVWHFKENLLQNAKIRKYIEDGGQLVFPLPEFEIVGKKELQ